MRKCLEAHRAQDWDELRRLYVDVTDMTAPASFLGVRELFGMNRMMFGSDFPFSPTLAATAGGLAALELPPQELQAIERDNALALFPRLK